MPGRERAMGRGARARFPGARACAVAAAALLAACTVDVNGAPCSPPFEGSCPSGQACGNDKKCSARALACAASRCTPGEGGACLDPSGDPTTGVGTQASRCTADDPVCGKLIVEPCAADFECTVRAPGWCACKVPPPGSREILVRPQGSPRGAPPYFATGAASPAVCSFRSLTEGLDEAAVVVADPLAVATVTAKGAGAGATRKFTGEGFPLVVPGRVTLGSDAPAGGGSYEIVFDGAAASSAAVELHSGGALAGFTVRNGTGGAAGDAIALRCDGRTDPALLTSVVLEGLGTDGARLGHGLVVDGPCGVAASGTQIRNFSVAGLLLDTDPGVMDPAPLVSLSGGSITACGDGARVRFGNLALHAVRIAGNAGMGIRANDDATGIPRVEIRNCKVVGNGDTGIAIVSPAQVGITGTTVYANGAQTAWGGPTLSAARKAGGIVLFGNPPAAAEFGRNRIYGNSGDQVVALGTASTSTWVLDGPASCGSDAAGPLYSVIGCYDPTPAGTTVSYRGVVAIDAGVSVKDLGWQTVTPSASVDVWKYGSGSVSFTPWCPADPTLSCTSEDPGP